MSDLVAWLRDVKREAPMPAGAASAPPSEAASPAIGRPRRGDVASRGRQRNVTAHFFERITTSSESPRQRSRITYDCRYCHVCVPNDRHALRLARSLIAHLRECTCAPAEVKSTVSLSPSSSPSSSRPSATHTAAAESSPRALVTSAAASSDTWEADVARLFIEGAVPLQSADAPAFRSFFSQWIPGRTLPSSEELLGRTYAATRAAVVGVLNSLGSVVVLVDASALAAKGTMTVMLTAASRERPPLYWASAQVDTAQPQAKKRAKKKILGIIRELRSKAPECRVAGILTTDATSVLGATWDDPHFERILYAGPSAVSTVKSLLQDVVSALPTIESVKERAESVLRCMADSPDMQQQFQSLRAWFYPDKQAQHPLLLSITQQPRQMHMCLKSLNANKGALRQLFPVQAFMQRTSESTAQQAG